MRIFSSIAAASRLAYFLRYTVAFYPIREKPPGFEAYVWATMLAMGLWVLIYFGLNFAEFRHGWELSKLFWEIFQGVTLLMLGLLALSYLQQFYFSRLLLAAFSLLLFLMLSTVRLVGKPLLVELKQRRIGVRRLVIVGTPRLTQELARHIETHQELGYEIAGHISPAETADEDMWGSAEYSGGSGGLLDFIVAQRVDELLFALPVANNAEILELIARCQQKGIVVNLLSDFYDLWPFGQFSQLGRLPVMKVIVSPPGQALKRMFDLLVGTVLFLLLLPLMALVALLLALLRMHSFVIRQPRVGQFGRVFLMYKFNKPVGSPAADGGEGSWAAAVGTILDKYSLLELPQLVNVLKGEMSLVGPRPEKPERVARYSEWNKKRLMMKPGVTGLAQVMGLRGAHSTDEKTRYDLEYISNASLTTDVLLLSRSLFTIARRAFQAPPPPETGRTVPPRRVPTP